MGKKRNRTKKTQPGQATKTARFLKRFQKGIPGWAWLTGMILFAVIDGYCVRQGIADKEFYGILVRILLTSLMLYYIWIYRERPKRKSERLLLTAYALLLNLQRVLPPRIGLAIKLVLFFALLVVWLRHTVLQNKEQNTVMLFMLLFMFLDEMWTASDYVFLKTDFPFWGIGLAAAILFGGWICTLLHRGRIQLKSGRPNAIIEVISVGFLAVLASFVITILSIEHVNYIFDSSDPVLYSTTIQEKRISSSRSGTDYYFTAEILGEAYDFSVLETEYRKKSVYDPMEVFLYEGALGQPYYLYKYK